MTIVAGVDLAVEVHGSGPALALLNGAYCTLRSWDPGVDDLAEHYTEREEPEKAGALWKAWAERVAPLDADPGWQGLVHYNAACGMALGGDPEASVRAQVHSVSGNVQLADIVRLQIAVEDRPCTRASRDATGSPSPGAQKARMA